jgi:hypothetical protein
MVISKTWCDYGDFGADKRGSSDRSQEFRCFFLYGADVISRYEDQEHHLELHDVFLQNVAAEVLNKLRQFVVAVHAACVHERL